MFLTQLSDASKEHIKAWVRKIGPYARPGYFAKYKVNGEIEITTEYMIATDQRFLVVQFNGRHHSHYSDNQSLDAMFTAIDGLLGGYIPDTRRHAESYGTW